MIIKNNGIKIKCYGDSVAPYQLADEINVFCWSIPFLAESVTSMLLLLLSKSTNDDILEEDEKMEEDKLKRKKQVKNKIRAVAKMNINLKNLQAKQIKSL